MNAIFDILLGSGTSLPESGRAPGATDDSPSLFDSAYAGLLARVQRDLRGDTGESGTAAVGDHAASRGPVQDHTGAGGRAMPRGGNRLPVPNGGDSIRGMPAPDSMSTNGLASVLDRQPLPDGMTAGTTEPVDASRRRGRSPGSERDPERVPQRPDIHRYAPRTPAAPAVPVDTPAARSADPTLNLPPGRSAWVPDGSLRILPRDATTITERTRAAPGNAHRVPPAPAVAHQTALDQARSTAHAAAARSAAETPGPDIPSRTIAATLRASSAGDWSGGLAGQQDRVVPNTDATTRRSASAQGAWLLEGTGRSLPNGAPASSLQPDALRTQPDVESRSVDVAQRVDSRTVASKGPNASHPTQPLLLGGRDARVTVRADALPVSTARSLTLARRTLSAEPADARARGVTAIDAAEADAGQDEPATFESRLRQARGEARGTQALPLAAGTAKPAPGGVADQLGSAFAARFTSASGGTVDIQLTPRELGTVQIRVEQGDDGARVWLSASEPASRELIEAQLPRLRALMSDAGLTLADVQIAGRNPDSGSRQTDRDETRQAAESSPEDADSSLANGSSEGHSDTPSGLIDAYA